ncbi:hypothetical protein [Haloarchaeobius baliensis]|uniref:hypothetical protein n=1 Tax=Haloarchaeobius baliensis TaxID=1670458 RepID=UPI003F8812B2
MPTPFEIAQLATAAGIPVSLHVVMNQVRDVKWRRLAPAIVINAFLAVWLLASEGVISLLGGAFIVMLLLGHLTTFLDTD